MIRAALVLVPLLVPSAALACGMESDVTISLADLLDQVDAAEVATVASDGAVDEARADVAIAAASPESTGVTKVRPLDVASTPGPTGTQVFEQPVADLAGVIGLFEPATAAADAEPSDVRVATASGSFEEAAASSRQD